MYKTEEPLRVIDFGYSPSFIIDFARSPEALEYPESALEELNQYLIIWPLIATCSVRVRIKSNTFKPEYILPAGEGHLHVLNFGFEDTPNLTYGFTDFGRFERFLEERIERKYL